MCAGLFVCIRSRCGAGFAPSRQRAAVAAACLLRRRRGLRLRRSKVNRRLLAAGQGLGKCRGTAKQAAPLSQPTPFFSSRQQAAGFGVKRPPARACRAVRGALGVSPRGLLALPGQRAARRRGRSRGCGPRPPMPRWMAPQWGAVCAARPAASGAQKSAPSPGALSYSISSRASSSVMPSATTCTAAPPASSSAPAIGGLP